LAVKDISSQHIESPKGLEVVTVLIGSNNLVKICMVYNPPNSSLEYKHSLINYLQSFTANSSELHYGDFNVPDIDWATWSSSSPFSDEFCDTFFQYNLSQLVDQSTHICGNIRDLILTNCEVPLVTFLFILTIHLVFHLIIIQLPFHILTVLIIPLNIQRDMCLIILKQTILD